ncbi:hypothetical protein NQ314_019717 [Rhamnusium bicolor]|uniref:DDE Tnp4 domain-containing protein n=1 Tax=Rhamnusium bicolor TaxID=1586634 RepID=A0AAV8WNA7_9CUCU|nr:hypothetical protein NQ314_019717 [Rhamnusium bicolor]
MNRKGYYSIQMQAVCDNTRKIRDLYVGYPGAVHDSRVFRNLPLCNSLEDKCGRYYLLGDSGYPLKTKLLTPFKDSRQLNYNIKLAKSRYVIEHYFGILKQKFRQLFHIKLRNITFIIHFIRAACVLHNAAIDDEFQLNENIDMVNEVLPPEQDLDFVDEEEDRDARRVRDDIVNDLRM